MSSSGNGPQSDDTYKDESEHTSWDSEDAGQSFDPDSTVEQHQITLGEPFADPDATVEIDYSVTLGEMADLAGVNRGVLTEGRYGARDKSAWPADFTRLYLAIGVTSVRTHGDCFDVANIFGLFPPSAGMVYDDLPIIHSIEFEEYWTAGASGASVPTVDPSLIRSVRDDILLCWKNLFEKQHLLTWGPDLLAQLYVEAYAAFGGTSASANTILAAAAAGNTANWLFWYPKSEAVANSSNYRTIETGASAAYRALIDAGIEVYFRLGERMGGPTYMADVKLSDEFGSNELYKLRYADVAKQVLHDLTYSFQIPPFEYGEPIPPLVPPRFIEIWNEPDGEFYADIHGNHDDAFGEDFGDLYGGIARQLRPAQFQECAAASVGGSGFTRGGMLEFLDKLDAGGQYSKVYEILNYLSCDYFDFVSFHWYSNSDDDEEVPTEPRTTYYARCFLERALTFAEDLSRFTEGLRWFYQGFWQITDEEDYPEIHVSEWNIQLPTAAASNESPMNWCVGIENAAFVSAAMTWMQSSTIGITKAHLFAGRDLDGGLFSFDYLTHETLPVWGEEEPQTLPVWGDDASGYRLKVRPSAIAFYLYSDLAGLTRVPVAIGSLSVIDAALDGEDVTAVAFTDEEQTELSFILTNLSDSPRDVNIEFSELPPATYQVTSTSVDPRMPYDGATIPHGDIEWDARCQPKEGVAEAAIESCLHRRSQGFIPSSGPATMGVKIQAYGVIRVQLKVQ